MYLGSVVLHVMLVVLWFTFICNIIMVVSESTSSTLDAGHRVFSQKKCMHRGHKNSY